MLILKFDLVSIKIKIKKVLFFSDYLDLQKLL